MGGSDPNDRAALALTTSSRHPGVALVIASGNFPDEKQVAAAIVLCVLVNALLSTVYIKWYRGRQAPVDNGGTQSDNSSAELKVPLFTKEMKHK